MSGDRVSQVESRAGSSVLHWLPNVVLINAGTNDATQNGATESVSGTGARMKRMMNGIFSTVPNAVIVLSTLLPNPAHGEKPSWQHNVDDINNQYRALYREYVPLDKDGKEIENPAFKVILADMAEFIGDEHIHDGTHPTVDGEMRMAAVWDWAINRANEKGWLSEPSESGKFTDSEGTTTCKKELGSGNHDPRGGRQVLYASNPVIKDDGTYKHGSRPRGDMSGSHSWTGTEEMRVWFAQLVNVADAPKGGERDEVIYYSGDYEDRLTYFFVNGGGNFDGWAVELKIDDGCKTRGGLFVSIPSLL